ncbi:hypothetical protein PTKU46_94030 [Paraburkholderia terrae]|uniref:DUF29 family protein n=1 Tax=Paraburkholderia terrae TaxID=311230 RepID=UPI0030DF51C0
MGPGTGSAAAGRFEEIDVGHIADEIEDVARAEVRDITRRMAGLTAWLLRWQYQSELRSPSLRSPSCLR